MLFKLSAFGQAKSRVGDWQQGHEGRAHDRAGMYVSEVRIQPLPWETDMDPEYPEIYCTMCQELYSQWHVVCVVGEDVAST